MMRVLRVLLSVILFIESLFAGGLSGGGLKAALPQPQTGEAAGYVDLFTGTGGYPWMCGMLSPAASAPFGCVRLGPDLSLIHI